MDGMDVRNQDSVQEMNDEALEGEEMKRFEPKAETYGELFKNSNTTSTIPGE
jgi:hypothetical protein